MGIWYATLDDVEDALDVAETARSAGQVSRGIDAGSRAVEGRLRRRFYPTTATRYFPWPNRGSHRSWRLWLDGDELISVTQLVAGGVIIPSSDYLLEPVNTGPPFDRIEIDLSGSSAFAPGDTHQRAIAVTGLWGHRDDEEPAGALAAAVADAVTIRVDVTDSAAAGVGDIIRVDDERMIIAGRSMLDTGQTTGGPLTASAADVALAVADGTAYHQRELLLIDAERVRVDDIAGNTLVIARAVRGSVLAAHLVGAAIFAPRALRVARGALGTTAAAHAAAAPVARHAVPGLVRELCIGESVNIVQQERSGYARTAGSGEAETLVGGRGLADIRREARAAFGRTARKAAV